MWPIAAHVARSVVCVSACMCVCLCVGQNGHTDRDGPIEMLLGQAHTGPRNNVLDGGTHWRNIANARKTIRARQRFGFLSIYCGQLFRHELSTKRETAAQLQELSEQRLVVSS